MEETKKSVISQLEKLMSKKKNRDDIMQYINEKYISDECFQSTEYCMASEYCMACEKIVVVHSHHDKLMTICKICNLSCCVSCEYEERVIFRDCFTCQDVFCVKCVKYISSSSDLSPQYECLTCENKKNIKG